MAVVAQMIEDGQDYGSNERSPGHPDQEAVQLARPETIHDAYDNEAIELSRKDLLYLRGLTSQEDLVKHRHQVNLIENFVVISDEGAESDLQKFCQNTLDKAELAQLGIHS